MSINSIEVFDGLAGSEAVVPAQLPAGAEERFIFDAFLLYPQNRAFLVGAATRLANYPGAKRVFGLLLVFALLSSIVAFVTLPGWWDANELADNGQLTDAQVESRRIAEDREGTRTYYLTYLFWANETGRYYSREQAVSRDTYERLVEGAPVSVRYLPSNPDRSALDQEPTETRVRSIAAVLSGVAALVVLITLVAVLRGRRRLDQLVQDGRVLPGEVVQYRGCMDHDGHFHVNLQYRVVTPDGRALIRVARRRADELRLVPAPSPGDPVAVLYESDKRFRLL